MYIENGSLDPTILVTWLGWNHGELNLDRISPFTTLFTDHLERSSGRKILILENFCGTYSEAEKLNDEVRKYGGLSNHTLAIFLAKKHQNPSVEAVLRFKDELEDTSIENAIDKGLLPDDDIAEYYLNKEIDRLQSKYGFEIEMESHPKPVAKEIEMLYGKVDKYRSLADQLWAEGKFDLSLQSVQKAERTEKQQANSVREHSFINKLKSDLRKLRKEGSGSIFVTLGAAHNLASSAIQNEVGSIASVRFTFHDLEQQPLKLIIGNLIGRGETVPDLLLARYMLWLQMFNEIENHLGHKKIKSILANNYGLFRNASETAVQNLSLEEIRKICETKTDLLSIVQNNPVFLSNPILNSIL
jgi:hypothetical protein